MPIELSTPENPPSLALHTYRQTDLGTRRLSLPSDIFDSELLTCRLRGTDANADPALRYVVAISPVDDRLDFIVSARPTLTWYAFQHLSEKEFKKAAEALGRVRFQCFPEALDLVANAIEKAFLQEDRRLPGAEKRRPAQRSQPYWPVGPWTESQHGGPNDLELSAHLSIPQSWLESIRGPPTHDHTRHPAAYLSSFLTYQQPFDIRELFLHYCAPRRASKRSPRDLSESGKCLSDLRTQLPVNNISSPRATRANNRTLCPSSD